MRLKTPAVKFLELVFRNNFLSSILAKCIRDESCRGDFPPTSPKGLLLVASRYLMYIDDNFAINLDNPKFLSLY